MWGVKSDEIFRNYRKNESGELENLNIAYFKEYLKNIENGERHQIGWLWRKQSGHTILVERRSGVLNFIDPQTNKVRNFKEFQDWTKTSNGFFWAFRIDDRELDKNMLKLIMKGKS